MSEGNGELECKRCGYRWQPRAEKPVACPKCKSYFWQVPKPPTGWWREEGKAPSGINE